MRMLDLNKINLWYVNPDGIEVELKDDDGYYTGEVVVQYNEPVKISLHLYPASGKILEESFGPSTNIDFITTTDIKLEKEMLLFREKPDVTLDKDLSSNYDFKIDNVLESLNSYQYGIKGRRS